MGAAAYALYEPYRYRLAELDVPVGRGLDELSILQVSDLHMGGRDRRLRRFLEALPERLGDVPDLVVATGDLIGANEGIEPAVAALARLEARLGRFYVLGSHDYYVPRFGSYLKYFTGPRPVKAPRARTTELEEGLVAKGWRSLTNRTEILSRAAGDVRVTGLDDPYLGRHRTEHIERGGSDMLAIGVVHTPDVVSEWALAGYDLVLAGHTHGGQVRIPGMGAVVTNCALPAALAGGLHRIGETWLHVSPGLGTGRYSPLRFNCPPEATLLRLRSH